MKPTRRHLLIAAALVVPVFAVAQSSFAPPVEWFTDLVPNVRTGDGQRADAAWQAADEALQAMGAQQGQQLLQQASQTDDPAQVDALIKQIFPTLPESAPSNPENFSKLVTALNAILVSVN